MSRDIFCCHEWGVGALLASSEWRSGMLLNLIQYGRKPPHNRLGPNISNAEIEKS